MSARQKITEEERVHEEWYTARPKTTAELAEFVRHLVEDYEHDYGTICHAVAAAGLAAMRCVNTDSDQGGITGFQASCVLWSVIARWTGEAKGWEGDVSPSATVVVDLRDGGGE